jgi:hypothetical protein
MAVKSKVDRISLRVRGHVVPREPTPRGRVVNVCKSLDIDAQREVKTYFIRIQVRCFY